MMVSLDKCVTLNKPLLFLFGLSGGILEKCGISAWKRNTTFGSGVYAKEKVNFSILPDNNPEIRDWCWQFKDSNILLKAFSLIIHIDYIWDKSWVMLIKNIIESVMNTICGQCKPWYIVTLLSFLKNGLFHYLSHNVAMKAKQCSFILPPGTLPLSCWVTIIWLFLAGFHVFSSFLWVFSLPQGRTQ